MDKNLKNLEKLLSVLDTDSMTQDDFVKYFEVVIEFVQHMKVSTDTELQNIQELYGNVRDDNKEQLATMKDRLMNVFEIKLQELKKDSLDRWDTIETKVSLLKDGKDADEERIIQSVLSQIPEQEEQVMENAVSLRDKLESLEGDERLDKSAIKGLAEALNDLMRLVSTRPSGGGGSGGIEVFSSAGKIGSGSAIRFLGTAIASVVNRDGHITEVTINGGGSGGSGYQAATGTVNGGNKSFTFATAPSAISVDFMTLQKISSDGTVNWTGATSITLTVAPNFDIFAVA